MPLPRMLQEHLHHLEVVVSREDVPAPALAMLRLPGMSPGCRRVVVLGMSQHTGCSLLHAHTLGLPVVFWAQGESVADSNPCGLPWGKAVVPATSSLSRSPPSLPQPPAAPHGQGARGFSQNHLRNSVSRGTTRVSEQQPEALSKTED